MDHAQKLVTSRTESNREIGSPITTEKSFDEGNRQNREEITSKNQIIKENDSFLNE